ncbi:HNH endonuclease signature motif containing protein [Candidatus Blastococcus massiliensis]|uniref:HNH endonuclease signature motif containing protein n=1 Tax=Candidatus Blastococcus massiliensis TaxID=1470358 RepID=UPI0004B9C6DF|nr:HNH endonuclease signature motif containing protein [Candidatus Blastococcus massiliensis]
MRSNRDSDGTPLDELAAAITTGAVRLAAATAAWLRLVAEFDRRGGWNGVGILSCAHWLAWQCGLGPGAAREHVRVARALTGLPRIEAAFAAGRLSYSKVRALTRIAEPDCEEMLIEFALAATASQTERFCRQWRQADDAAAGTPGSGRTAREAEDGMTFEHWYDDDGFLTLKVRMPAADGAALMTAVEGRAERDARRERAQAGKAAAAHEAIEAAGGTVDADLVERCAEDSAIGRVRERRTARRVAALAELVSAGAAQEERRPGDPPRREVVVHVDAAVLADDTAAGRAYLDGGPPITGAQVRRMLCEATVVAMLEREREPLAVGRRKRRATRAQWRALLRRDGGCARPGCPETRVERLHAHHMRHWLVGGPTDIDNLVLLCDVDHGLVHEHDLVVRREGGRLVVTTPDGHRVWGGADAAFVTGVDGPAPDPLSGADPFAGVHPIDTTAGRRPTAPPSENPLAAGSAGAIEGSVPLARPRRRPSVRRRRGSTPTRPRPAGPHPTALLAARRSRLRGRAAATAVSVEVEARRLERTLFPEGAPRLAALPDARCERLDMAYALGVLMTNRDLVRRLEVERGLAPDVPAGTPGLAG